MVTDRQFQQHCQELHLLPPGNFYATLVTRQRQPLEFGKPPEYTVPLIIAYETWEDQEMIGAHTVGEMPWDEWDLAMSTALGAGVPERCQAVYTETQSRVWDTLRGVWVKREVPAPVDHPSNKTRIRYFGQMVGVSCAQQCQKAWGRHTRPTIQLSEDADDFAYLADDELGEAPRDPGTYEGGDGKPTSPDQFPNKWCVRECERCQWHGEGLTSPPDFGKRVYNMPDKHRKVSVNDNIQS